MPSVAAAAEAFCSERYSRISRIIPPPPSSHYLYVGSIHVCSSQVDEICRRIRNESGTFFFFFSLWKMNEKSFIRKYKDKISVLSKIIGATILTVNNVSKSLLKTFKN
jgi:hypothetical protein